MLSISEEDADLVLKVLREKLEKDSKQCELANEDIRDLITAIQGGDKINEVAFTEASKNARKEILGPIEKAIEIMTCGSKEE